MNKIINYAFLFLFCLLSMHAYSMLAPLGNDYKTLFEEAHNLIDAQNLNKARRNLEWLTLHDTDYERKMMAHVLLGNIFRTNNEMQMAKFHLICSFKQSKNSHTRALAAYGLGYIALKKNNFEKAACHLSNAAKNATDRTMKHDCYSNYFKLVNTFNEHRVTFDNTDDDNEQKEK